MREQRTLAKIYYFVLVSWNWISMNDREAFQADVFDSERPNISHKNVSQLSINDVYPIIMIFCPIVHR